MNIGYTRSTSVNAMEAGKKTSFFGKWITDESEYKKLQPTALGAANLAAELQDKNATIILYMRCRYRTCPRSRDAGRWKGTIPGRARGSSLESRGGGGGKENAPDRRRTRAQNCR